ncbi:phage tail length tape measure family protein [Pseudomonas aeruginosa]|uniref:phage tail length tape measure family protein n=1 Tax=Pseudomonas aeruginosa TaxID=287 RepID=UPI00232F61CD|nr:phage tail length tape measure family protein [Pseudomonas aeruginosa]
MATDSLGTLTVDLIANTGGFERGMDAAERRIASTTRAFQRQEQAAERLVGRIDPVAGAINRLVQEQTELERHFRAGIIPAGEFERLNRILNDQLDAVQRGNREMASGAMSARQYQAALRGVPAQFTDIAVSLASGQQPLTVLLQQGGQLKDMFGGVVPAARALGGYIAGLINPVTGLAAAVGVLGISFIDAEREAAAFNKAIFAGNNAAGVSGSGLSQIAEQASAVTGSLSNANKAAITLASSGKVAASQLQSLTEATIAIAQFTGKEVDDVAKSLSGMGDSATDAAAKISEQYGLLTYEQYQVIKSIDEQGNSQRALDVLGEELNRNAQERLKQYRESLSDIERDWIDIKTAITNTYAAIRSEIFPNQNQQIEQVQRILRTRQEGGVLGTISGAFGFGDNSTESLQKQLDSLVKQRDASAKQAEEQAKITKSNQDRIEASRAWEKESEKYLSSRAKMEKEISAARELGRKAGLNEIEIEDRIAQIRKSYEEKPSSRSGSLDAGQRMLDSLRQQYASMQAQLEATEKLGTQAQALVKWEQQLADLKSRGSLSADQKALLANADLITAQLKRNAALEDELNTRKEIQKTLDDYKRLNESLRTDAEKQLDLTRQRFEILDKARQAGISDDDYRRTAERIVASSTTKAPTFSGVDAVVAGPQGELDKLDKAQEDIEAWYEQQLEILNENREKRAELNASWDEQELKLKQDHEDAMAAIEQSRQQITLSANEEFFGNLSGLAKAFFGEQSGLYKAAFVAEKAFAVAKALINVPKAASDAYNAMLPIPIVGPALGAAAAATAVATQLAQVASIRNVNLSGMAHDGIDAVPETGTWLLQKGERVTTAETSAKLDRTLDDVRSNQSSGGAPTINLIEDRSRAGQVNTRRQDDQYIIDVVVADLFGDGRTSKAIGSSFGMRRSGT